ncbi:TIGR03546 family protein [bacterium]
MLWLKLLNKILKILHSNASAAQISFGFSFGVIWGFLPVLSIQWFLFLFISIMVNINLGMFFIAAALAKILALLISFFAHKIGSFALIDLKFLKGFWTFLYNIPVVPFTKFNNTVVMGNLIISVILAVACFFLVKSFVNYYRKYLVGQMDKYRIVRFLKTSKIYSFYKKIMLLKD